MKRGEHCPYYDFDEYLRQGEPHRRKRAESWKTAIGLQAVDGLKPSAYLLETAKRHIEGDISIDEVKNLIDSYYQSKSGKAPEDGRTEEADKVSANITGLLNEKAFTFSPAGYISIHRRIFAGVFDFAGQIRDYNITKKEWVLRGDTVLYASAAELCAALEYDFAQEKRFNYSGLSVGAVAAHITKFVSDLWQVHAFGEGNTRTTAVFTIKYLRSIGFEVNNDTFVDNAWYFRNALVRANYRNYQKGIEANSEYLERFFRNLLLGERNELKNSFLLVGVHYEGDEHGLSRESAPNRHPTTSLQAPCKFNGGDPNILRLVMALGEKQMSVKEMLTAVNLRDRGNFTVSYLEPAIMDGFIRLLYPGKPNHPRQKYLLTDKGLALYRNAAF